MEASKVGALQEQEARVEEAKATLAAEHRKELLRIQGECTERIEAAAR